MKQSMFSNPFGFEGRIRRMEYGISWIIYLSYAFLLGLLIGLLGLNDNPMVEVIALVPAYWFIIAQNAKRCHDRENSGWYQLIPFYGFVLLFLEGTSGENDYGPDPKGNDIEE